MHDGKIKPPFGVAFSFAVTLISGGHEKVRHRSHLLGIIMANSLGISIAPEQLWQAINPWTFYQQGGQFGLINVNLGQTPRPDIEQAVLDEVGSYGRQLGRIGDALEVLIRRLKPEELTKDEADTLAILEGQLAQIRRVKKREYGEK